ncbi:MAG: ABC transporter permease [Acidimicrobiaceae bacterium]|nr:ABC transporter permease [Acidimicrobiaceae bacterium]
MAKDPIPSQKDTTSAAAETRTNGSGSAGGGNGSNDNVGNSSNSAAGVSRPLIDVTKAPSVPMYLREAWQRREFAIVVPLQDLRAKNMDTVLGQLWHLVNPAMLVGVYFLIFGVILDTRRGVDNFLGFLLVGIVLFHLIQRIAQDASSCVARHIGLIRSIQFPRILLPVSAVNGQAIAFLPALMITLVTLIFTGERPSPRWLVLPVVLVALLFFNFGVGLLLARVGSSIRDLQQLLPHLLRLVLYASGVIFNVDTFISSEVWRKLFALNPVYDVITCARWCLLGLPVDPWVVVGLAAWAVLLPLIAFAIFYRNEKRFDL